ncbi:hypothetical protein AA0472_0732 [Acetobacter estunensis NRIC 0472]|uniref:DUF445 family protein n=1 Tax=Acetobacter estunensis TaxID=104097 RepID=A0A967EIK6_9PROT|nr:DUF445 domain-containing protein [Acetobacter estunensis]NHO53409.1 DUF445 family protein [Acetobacter estunensis]GBQ22305.1 hypothetical protein AA0472_0732 [Acetobacter estunensis NRIC 0472]
MNTRPLTDDEARHALTRQKRAATGLLAFMGGLTAVGYLAPLYGWVSENLWLDTLRAGAKAGVVGGLADWFAVTALFRHPMGLPIPHTAIIPAQKERLGRALGRFVTTQVFTEEEVDRVLARIDLPGFVGRLLSDPATAATLTSGLVGAVPQLLERLEDGRASAAVDRTLPLLLGGSNLAPVIARGLRALVDGNHHQEVLTFLLQQLKSGLQAREPALRTMIEERVREQGGRLLGWAIGGSIASKVLVAASEELDRINPDDSSIREGFTAWVHSEIDRLENDPKRADDLSQVLKAVFSHETMQTWGTDIWARVKRMIGTDLEREDGWSATLIREALFRLAAQAQDDPAMRARIKETARKSVHRSLPYLREHLSNFIASVVGNWDAVSVSEKLELRVGRDLQYVRVNGTLVGFGVGALLSLFLELVFGVTGQ